MGILERLKQVLLSQVNASLDKAEDPKKMQAQALLDLMEAKRRAERLLISAMAHLKMVKDQESQRQEALTITALKSGIRALENKIAETKENLRHPPKTSTVIPEEVPYDALSDTSAFDTFALMEDKIQVGELEIEALMELLKENEPKETTSSGPSLDKHSDPTSIEDEISAIKKKL